MISDSTVYKVTKMFGFSGSLDKLILSKTPIWILNQLCRPSRGIEPLSGDPQSPILATVLRGPRERKAFYLVIIVDFCLMKFIL